MKKQIFHSVFLAGIIVLLASLIAIMGVLYNYFSTAEMGQLETETKLVAAAVEDNGLDYLNSISDGDYRITWISQDGTVIFDNKADANKMENHLEREEIKEAIATGTGESSRYSTTLMERQIYVAKKLRDGTILRLSATHLSVLSLLISMIQSVCIIIAVCVAIALLLAFSLSKKIIKPLSDFNPDKPEQSKTYEELEPIVQRIQTQQKELAQKQQELDKRKNEFDASTKNMREGILLLNENGNILSVNDSAMSILSLSKYAIGKDIALFDKGYEISALLDEAKHSDRVEKIFEIDGEDYQFNVSRIISNEKVSGFALIIFDITEKEKAENARREFTANVSHELKTPLQSILGASELIASGITKPEDTNKFANQINNETKRMITLVEDIIKLSHLDEGSVDMNWQNTDIYKIALDTAENLKDAAERAEVTLNVNGESAVCNCIPQLMTEVTANLIDNAIKYNREQGKVDIQVKDEGDEVALTVKDTGIGIPENEISRIFERFYRVDKSHSKEVGGTGLGLSIVKHAVKIHNGSVDVHSILDRGTEITVRIPKNQPTK